MHRRAISVLLPIWCFRYTVLLVDSLSCVRVPKCVAEGNPASQASVKHLQVLRKLNIHEGAHNSTFRNGSHVNSCLMSLDRLSEFD